MGEAAESSDRDLAEMPPAFLAARYDDWQMFPGERAAFEGVLSALQPSLSIEIGTARGGSLERVSRHSDAVHAFDLVRHESLTAARFPNVTFHMGDSRTLLPELLDEFTASGEQVEFAFVDGGHAADVVCRDLMNLLESPCTERTVILLHDTLNERVRAGIRGVPFDSYNKVMLVDLDFVAVR